MTPTLPSARPVALWLLLGTGMIAAMVAIGGVTRLTGSGLSITEWNVLMGTWPPLSEQDWVTLFGKYQATPQYALVNSHFTLEQFKGIFWWEYGHRLVGRALGLVFLVPAAWFLVKGYLDRRLRVQVLGIFLLGGLQGVLGWLMVASGLVDRPSVSHYRLAAHLLTALLTMSVTFWVALEVLHRGRPAVPVPVALRRQVWLFVTLLVIQITYGAFVAGLKAGFAYNTFPLMGEHLVPDGLLSLHPAWRNLTENPATVQFVHRTLAWSLALFGIWLWYSLRVHAIRRGAHLLLAALSLQFTLGVVTILRLPEAPVLWGTVHQSGAVVLLAASVFVLFAVRRGEPAAPGHRQAPS
ncbi:MAG: heme synthase [Gemmatimonadetes bacterium]|nr:heme synthase [Gemmatimonadota bacterium]